MDDVEVTLLRHIAGAYDRVLGQLCSRCGMVLDEGDVGRSYLIVPGEPNPEPPRGWPPGEAIMVSVGSGARFKCTEAALRYDRDRSDEADCASPH